MTGSAMAKALEPLRQAGGRGETLFHNLVIDLRKGILAFAHVHAIPREAFRNAARELGRLGFASKKYGKRDFGRLETELGVEIPRGLSFSGAVKITSKKPGAKRHLRELRDFEAHGA